MKVYIYIFLILHLSGFAAEISPAMKLIQKSCIDCHDEDVQKGDIRLDNLQKISENSHNMHTWLAVYDKVASGEMPPKKKAFTEEQKNEFLATLGSELKDFDEQQKKSSGRVVLRRLSASEYENSIKDLLHLPHLDVKHYLPADTKYHGIENVADRQQIAYNQIAQYLEAAETSLQAAVALKPQPRSRTRRFPGPKVGAARKAFQKAYKVIGDKLILAKEPVLAQGPWSLASSAEEPGFYKLRFKAHTAQLKDSVFKSNDKTAEPSALLPGNSKQTVALGVALGRFLHSFDLTPESAIQECTVWLNGSERISLNCADLPLRSSKYTNNKKPKVWDAIALEWFEIEGPLINEWPPAGHQALFGKLPVKKWTKESGFLEPREIAIGTGEIRSEYNAPGGPYFIESQNPQQDSFRLLSTFMERAYRRPVTEEEVKAMQAKVLEALSQKICFQDAMLIAYKAVLCSPDFLYIHEQPGPLTSMEIATRMSLFLWRSIPDQQLMDCAKADRLKDVKVMMSEAKRMLDDPRALRFIDDFTNQWLSLDEIYSTTPDKTLYPEYHEKYLLIESMVSETREYVREMLKSNLPIDNFIDSDFTFLNESLADHYDISGVKGSHFRKVKLPENSIRGGIITHGSMMKITANGFTTSPITRGIWILERILGTPPPPPPQNAGSVEPDTRGAKTIREQLARHRQVESCATCHKTIDPPGFALESLDVMGAYREKYRSMSIGKRKTITKGVILYDFKEGLPVDATGEFDGNKFSNIQDFKNILLKNKRQIARNIVNRLVTQSTGAVPGFSDRRVIEQLLDASEKENFKLKSIIGRVLMSPMFLEK